MNKDQYRKRLDELKADRDKVLAAVAPLEEARQKQWEIASAASAEWKRLGEELVAAKGPEFRDTCNEIAVLTRALGKATGIKAEGGDYGVTLTPAEGALK
jgi:hypothetical protein